MNIEIKSMNMDQVSNFLNSVNEKKSEMSTIEEARGRRIRKAVSYERGNIKET